MAGYKPQDDRQIIQRSALSTSIGSAANSTLDVVLAQIDAVLVNLNGLQMITNKTIGLNNSGLLANSLQFHEISTPATDPAANILALYPKSDGHFYSLNSSGSETLIGSSSALPVGTAVTSFLTLTQFQSQVGTGWILSDGTAVPGSAYETLTGGSSVTASGNAIASATGTVITFSTLNLTANADTNSNTQLTGVSNVVGLAVGEIINAVNVPSLTTVVSIDQYTFALPGTPAQYTFAVHSSTQYIFTVSAANATAGATYSNNGQTFTVNSTIVGATTLNAVGTGNPLASGTLTLVTGTGDATITFSSFAFAGANATSGAVYSNNTHSFTVSSTITGGTSLVAIGTGDPSGSGTLTKTSGTGDATITFTSFVFGAHNATAGAVYTNNGQSFTVQVSIDDGLPLICTGTGAPLGSGTLTKISGTGDATITFTSVKANLTMSHNATGTTVGGITVWFSTFAVSTTGNVTSGSPIITNLASSVGISNSQVISSVDFNPNVTVSSIAVTTVPDCRATVLRGKDNGRGLDPNGDLPLGTYEGDAFLNHVHAPSDGTQFVTTGNAIHNAQVGSGAVPYNFGSSPNADTAGANVGSGNETRGKSTIANIFIRIN